MNVYETILKRKSVREFTPYKLSEQEIYRLERVITHAPSAGNLKPISYKIITDSKANKELSYICSNQHFIANASCNVILIANYEKTTIKYGDRGIRYVFLEAGHISQNLCLEAIELGLETCCIGAFDDKWLSKEFQLKGYPIYVISIGKQ